MQRRHFDVLVSAVGLLLAIVLGVFGFYFKERYDFAQNTVQDQLSAQKIFFPPKDALSPEELKQAGVKANAGKQVTTGEQAEVYANQFIALHLDGIAGGKTYSQMSSESRADPENAKLKGQVDSLFRGETLRGILLTTYGFWQLGQEAQLAMWICFIAAVLLLAFAIVGFVHAAKTPKDATI